MSARASYTWGQVCGQPYAVFLASFAAGDRQIPSVAVDLVREAWHVAAANSTGLGDYGDAMTKLSALRFDDVVNWVSRGRSEAECEERKQATLSVLAFGSDPHAMMDALDSLRLLGEARNAGEQ